MVQTPNVLARRRAEVPPKSGGRPRRRPLLRRFSAAHGLMVLSGLLAFVLVAALTAERGKVVEIAVARDDIASGTPVRPGDFEKAELDADSPVADRLVLFSDLASSSWVTDRAVRAGDPLRRSDLRASGEDDGLRSVSIPVGREHAAGGSLTVGDLIDVIDVVDGQAMYVVAGVEVAGVAPSGSSGGGITGGTSREYYVVVLVDADGALAIAQAPPRSGGTSFRSSGQRVALRSPPSHGRVRCRPCRSSLLR